MAARTRRATTTRRTRAPRTTPLSQRLAPNLRLRPLVGQGAWLLAVLMIVAGVLIERPSRVGYGSSLAILGGVLVFVASLGLIHLILGIGQTHAALSAGGGLLG